MNDPLIAPDAFVIHRHIVYSVGSNKSVMLLPFGCVHRHAPNHSESHWQAFLSRAKTMLTGGQKCLFLGMGDYDDMASAHERVTFADLDHESTQQTLDDFADSKVEALCKEMAFMRGHLVGLLEGNHYWQFQDGTTSTQRMCHKLNCKYLGTTTATILRLTHSKTSSGATCTFFAHHGRASGGRTPGGSVNSVEHMREVFPDCDIYLAGHDHRRWAVPLSTLHIAGPTNNISIRERTQWLVRTGSFLRAYVPGGRSYIARQAKPALDLGHVEVELMLKRQYFGHKEINSIDIHVRQ